MVLTFENLPQKVFEIFQQNEEILKQLRKLTPQQETEKYFTIDEVCNYLPDKPARATVYGMVHNKRIPYRKHSKKLIFVKSEIDFWIMQSKQKGGTSHEK